MIRVFIVEDQALVRGAIVALLSLDQDIEVIGDAENGQVAKEKLKSLSPDVVLTDIEMPHITGLELAQHLQQTQPNCKVVIMTTFSKAGYIRRAITLGVNGFVLKEAPSEYLLSTLKKVMNGQKVIDPELALYALEDADPLTDKERRALRLAGEGLKTTEIAAQLFLSDGTVRNYLSDAIAKLHATNRIDAARIAKQKGWL
ncbi:response regulator transcription factor [Pseudoalteromonas sp. SCSIO 43201]|uniref:Two-component system, NarL family, response regulator DesR n=1 Tax=Pseudoalteromonas peptidolytica F12-50-A1 TaxID=1315280 RepID=A0A8I0T5G5_9GAMM|nr:MULTISPECIES: response regulator transcription factor [Pseudoalteromonas]MBE0347223.1 two-component system, NarL family, response regulator DesR [Pseudoalteromonas peptidolytica F12-50-A1]NLR13863.1 response regulator transcription factor [Pseudoalteromonas peptidolytica]USD29012.1 response regulator transcription factor [Pseudoalteromonas sp. SCSIO 43201]GEK08245.1 DNA-binding response regulator [Pseudoalteromonas peptidolytica]